MKRASVNLLTLLLLVIVLTVTLVLNLPSASALDTYLRSALVYGVLTTFTLYFGVLLTEGELSATHVVGIVALLSQPPDAQPVMIWAIFLGSVFGGALLAVRTDDYLLRRPLTLRSARSVVAICARATLSFLVAGQFYTWLGGTLPVATLRDAATGPLVVFSLLYTAVYLATFLLEAYTDGHALPRLLRANAASLLSILVLPVPFAVVSAELVAEAPAALLMFVVGAGAFTLGLYALSRAQHQSRKQLEESRLLAVVSQSLQGELNLDTLLGTIYDQTSRLLNIRHFVVALYDGSSQRLRFPLARRNGQPYQPDSVPDDLLRHVLHTQQPLLIGRDVPGTAAQLGLTPPTEPVYAWLGVPLLAGGRLLGAMAVMSDEPQHRLKNADLRLLTTVAATASIAIDNAQLYATQTRRAERLHTLNRVMSLLTVTLSWDEVLDAVVSSVSLVSHAAGIALFLTEQETLKLARLAGLSDAYAAHPPRLLLTDFKQPPVLIADAFDDPRGAAQRDTLRQENKAAWLEMPLVVGETGVGVLVLYYNAPHLFSEAGVEIIRAFANQAAQAIKNARQYTQTDAALERRARQMFALAALGPQLNAPLPAPAIGELALHRALEVTRAHAGLLLLADNDDTLTVIAAAGYPADITPAALQHSIVAQVLRVGYALAVPDIHKAPLPPLLAAAQSQLAVPIKRDTTVAGVILLESATANAFHDEDLHFLTQLANHTLIALDNSRLFARVAEARDRMEVMLNAMSEAIILIDRSGVVALANPRVTLIGVTAADLRQRNINELLADEHLRLAARMGFESADHCRTLLAELQTADSWLRVAPAVYSLSDPAGARFIQRQLIPVSSEYGEPVGLLLVFYDQTEERELMQMRDDLSRMIVHDLRSPLTAVTTGLKLLRDVIPADVSYRSLVDSTTTASQYAIRKLLSRVDSLLDVSRVGQLALETEPVRLGTLVEEVYAELNPLAQDMDVVLQSDIGDDVPPLDVDADKVERVLQNLIDNALKFSPAASTITVRACAPGAAERFVRVEVADQGPGVPDEYKTRLFERFTQIKGRHGARRGVGLGLTFCKLAVEAHGGRLWIEDNPGGGSLFVFTLPVAGVPEVGETGEQPALNAS